LVQLQILYTADDASILLSQRTWTPVAGLATNPAAPVNANKIDPDTATIFGEHHNANADGVFYELLFDAVEATGIGIRMVRDPTDPDVLDGGGYGNHLPVREVMLFSTKTKDN